MTPKPIELLENIIKHTTDENDILLDCFAGTGSLGLACKNTNRRCILIEKKKNIFDFINSSLELSNQTEQLIPRSLLSQSFSIRLSSPIIRLPSLVIITRFVPRIV